MKLRISLIAAMYLCLAAVIINAQNADASSFQKEVNQNRIGFSASKYTQAGGDASNNAPVPAEPEPRVRYMVVPWHGQCATATQICTVVSSRHCERIHRDDQRNRWRPFDVYISYDGGHTYEGFADHPLHRGLCLNSATIDDKARPQLDPRLVIEKAAKLVPKGEWHPQPDGQAVANKPVIVTVDTNRDQTFKPFTLLGYHVEVKAHIDTYEWNYGDGSAAQTVDWPGQDFNSAIGPCSKTDCTDYVNHTYAHNGNYNIQLTLHWKATYRVDGGTWQNLPGTINTTSQAQTMNILNAHSELVNN